MKRAIGFLLDIIASAVIGAMLYVGLISGSVLSVMLLFFVLIGIILTS